jgi:hypothetical protein
MTFYRQSSRPHASSKIGGSGLAERLSEASIEKRMRISFYVDLRDEIIWTGS